MRAGWHGSDSLLPRVWRAVVALRRPARAWTSTTLAITLPLLFSLGSLALGAALGVYELDLQLSGYGEKIGTAIDYPVITGATTVLLIVPASVFNGVIALGEELGWRGYLLNELQDLHPLRADALIGLLWGLWHAPLVLLGYNYPTAPILGAFVLMPGMCIPMAIWIGWLRRRSESVWIAALAHGATNAAATLGQVFYRAGSPPDAVHATMTGWSGWLLPAIFAAWLAWSGRTPRSQPLDRIDKVRQRAKSQ